MFGEGSDGIIGVIEPLEGMQKEEYEEWTSTDEDIPVAATLYQHMLLILTPSGRTPVEQACPQTGEQAAQKTVPALAEIFSPAKPDTH
ncbi:hypothetical protein AVEN_131217-1 [Araneus ventricosus]|uniref:Uncharacterized protein n=1 Tax=Araneus ventricosus TaxID=182803 RepID=A0A4Y2PLV7_ARAVE|nr:hypothetical protein AVEN_131217-1 [Araneus ventricosus]